MLSADKALHRADAHVVIPTADGEAWDVHLLEVASAIFVSPIIVVVGMSKPLVHQAAIVIGLAADGRHPLEPLWLRGAANPIAFMKQAQARVNHVLTRQMRRRC